MSVAINYKLLLTLLGFILTTNVYAGYWTQKSDHGGLARHRPTAISIGNRGYLGLGHYNGTGVETYFSDWWEYDPGNDTWTQKADYIGNNGNGELGAQAMGLETVGYVGIGELDNFSFYKYDPATNQWSQVASAPGGNLFQDTDEFVIGHKGYFMDLLNGNNYEYDADTDVWTLRASCPVSPYYSYSGFSIGGFGYLKVMDQLWKYDPSVDMWSFVNNYPGAASLSSIDFVQNDKAYIVSGYIDYDHGNLVKEVWEFDPTSNIWTQYPDFPGIARRYSGGFTIGDKSYLGCGTNGTNLKDFWEFDATNTSNINELEEFEVIAYPNPATEKITISSEGLNSFSVKIVDVIGRNVLFVNSVSSSVSIARKDLGSGTYIYQVIKDNQVIKSDKFVFQ